MCSNAITIPNLTPQDIDKKVKRINEDLTKLFYLKTNNMQAIEEEEKARQSAIRKGLTGDPDIDKLILMYKLLAKKGLISSD